LTVLIFDINLIIIDLVIEKRSLYVYLFEL